ncbi:MAG: hemolysin III family protein, partial [Bacteroidales bacterium]
WGLFALVWFFALIGIALSFGEIKKNSNLKTFSYVLMGLTVFIAIKPIVNVTLLNDCVAVLYWIGAGGVFYIIGSVFYALAKREFIHTIFHVFVLLGMASHIIAAFLIPLS